MRLLQLLQLLQLAACGLVLVLPPNREQAQAQAQEQEQALQTTPVSRHSQPRRRRRTP